ncbi:uncharacterized protein M421DRAFT_242784 [Didymella exigua CBS 183.55]|uniref:Uncharacterized protein n=1 Tax=Didymella exigua CBS 183.55 TaxID=1150837 RepID=A0A6A5RCP2_9PLEO|nr:uncharacterized protein M421DRAFT_242784 [Didymella exigua CBS 183.55]KAF1925462.1 hypothetical protein M421DRAFT_242784 [Didymella exigua CBS 183.55]
MSSGLMDTEKGGEQTQYEAEYSDMLPHKQEAGQLGASAMQGGSTEQPTALETRKTDEPNTHGITVADKIRYGQSIQEGGMGGKTNTVTGQADKPTDETSAEKQRREQGYGGSKDMDRTIGA